MKLSEVNPLMELAPASHIKTVLTDKFGGEDWLYWELETISLELGMHLAPLVRDKIHVVQIMSLQPSLYFSNPEFFLHATEVLNNNVADFDSQPFPTSLELAWSLKEASRIITNYKAPEADSMISDIASYILREEGYSTVVAPFLFVPKVLLVAGQTEQDTKDKELAIQTYLKEMDNL